MDQLLYDWDINGDQQEMQYNCVVWLVKVSGIRAAKDIPLDLTNAMSMLAGPLKDTLNTYWIILRSNNNNNNT